MIYKKTVAAALALLLFAAVLFMFSCGENGEPVTVKIVDSGNEIMVDGSDGMTVRQFLEKAGVGFGEYDEVNPSPDRRWRDVGGTSITVRRYAKVTVVYGEKTDFVEMIGGTVDLAIVKAGYAPDEVTSDIDKGTYLYDGMIIILKKALNGLVEEKGKTYFYKGGDIQKDGIVGSADAGYYYADANGVIDTDYCAPIEEKGSKWNVIKGRASKVKTKSDEIMFYTLKAVANCTESGMTKEEKLKNCFYYLKENYLEGVRHDPPYTESDWYVVYAEDIFVYGKGDCFSYGAAMAYMGRAIGCEESYACNSLGHGWAEIDGLVYDVEWSFHSATDWIAVSYDDSSEVRYSNALNVDFEWKRMKITGSFDGNTESDESVE